MAMVLLPDGFVSDDTKKECPFCQQEYFSVVIRGRSCGLDKVEGVEGGYRPHECKEMMQAVEQLFDKLEEAEQ